MSLAFYPVFEPVLTITEFDYLGEVLADNIDPLDKIALSAKLTTLTAFADNRPVPDGFDGDPEDLAEALGEWTEWFDPAEGQAAVQALADHIKGSARAAKRLSNSIDVVEELEELARVLGAAVSQRVRFRFQFMF